MMERPNAVTEHVPLEGGPAFALAFYLPSL